MTVFNRHIYTWEKVVIVSTDFDKMKVGFWIFSFDSSLFYVLLVLERPINTGLLSNRYFFVSDYHYLYRRQHYKDWKFAVA